MNGHKTCGPVYWHRSHRSLDYCFGHFPVALQCFSSFFQYSSTSTCISAQPLQLFLPSAPGSKVIFCNPLTLQHIFLFFAVLRPIWYPTHPHGQAPEITPLDNSHKNSDPGFLFYLATKIIHRVAKGQQLVPKITRLTFWTLLKR